MPRYPLINTHTFRRTKEDSLTCRKCGGYFGNHSLFPLREDEEDNG